MFKPVNLSPVQELLTSSTSPESLAQKLDDLAYDYARIVMELHRANLSDNVFFNPQSAVFLWWLHELRDVFRACEIK